MAPSHPQHPAQSEQNPEGVTLAPVQRPGGSPVPRQPYRSLRMSSGLKRSRGSVCRLLLAKDLGDERGRGRDLALAMAKGQEPPLHVPGEQETPLLLTGESGT